MEEWILSNIAQKAPFVKYLVVIPGGYWQTSIILAAKSQGYSVIVVDSNPHAVGLHAADHQIVADLEDFELVREEIRLITKTIDGAVSFCSDVGISLSHYLNQVFEIKSKQFSDPDNFVSKSQQRKIWEIANILQPSFQCFDEIDSAISGCNSLDFPIVIKPVDSSGSRGVTILHHPADLRQALVAAFDSSKSNQVIVEAFMPGVEFTVEVFAVEGEILPLLVTQKAKIQNGTGTVSGYLRALSPGHPIYPQIASLAVDAYSALGLRNGPGHLELIADLEAGPIGVVEAAARGGGFGLSTKLMFEVTGISLVDETLKTVDGSSRVPIFPKFKPGVLFFIPSRKGTLIKIEGLAETQALEDVDITVLASIGTKYHNPTTDADRLCAIVVTANSEQDLDTKIELIREKLRFVFDE